MDQYSVYRGCSCFRRNIQISYKSAFQDGRISPALLWEELEDSAEQHCRLIGMDVFSLLNRQEAWVLKSGASRINRYPGYGETVEITTWISSMDRYRGYREFRLTDVEGQLIGEMSTLWVYIDLKERHLKAIPEEFHLGWGSRGDALHVNFHKKSSYPVLETFKSDLYSIRRRDLDSSAHVHNIRYLEWLSETINDETYRSSQMVEFSVLYRKEMRSGGTVEIRTQDLGDGVFRHDYYNKDKSILLCSAQSRWIKKEPLRNITGALQKVM